MTMRRQLVKDRVAIKLRDAVASLALFAELAPSIPSGLQPLKGRAETVALFSQSGLS